MRIILCGSHTHLRRCMHLCNAQGVDVLECRGNTSAGWYHVFRNVKIEWVREGQLGIVFYSPPGVDPAQQREPIRGWTFDSNVRIKVHYRQLAENDTAPDRHGNRSDVAGCAPHSLRCPPYTAQALAPQHQCLQGMPTREPRVEAGGPADAHPLSLTHLSHAERRGHASVSDVAGARSASGQRAQVPAWSTFSSGPLPPCRVHKVSSAAELSDAACCQSGAEQGRNFAG